MKLKEKFDSENKKRKLDISNVDLYMKIEEKEKLVQDLTKEANKVNS